ncbi:hypothetical protein GCM10010433_73270 [Streptomyces pulveraceus]
MWRSVQAWPCAGGPHVRPLTHNGTDKAGSPQGARPFVCPPHTAHISPYAVDEVESDTLARIKQ